MKSGHRRRPSTAYKKNISFAFLNLQGILSSIICSKPV
jgi:hypothetical protein